MSRFSLVQCGSFFYISGVMEFLQDVECYIIYVVPN